MVSAELERQINKLARPYIGEFAWPTVILGLTCFLAFCIVMYLGYTGAIPLWLGLILNTLILYADQTPLHEAVHGAIAGRNKNLMWLNHLIGMLAGAILVHEYKMFRLMHTYHHRDTNDPELDPDAWVFGKNPISILFRCLTIPYKYHYYFHKKIAPMPEHRREVIQIYLTNFFIYSFMFVPMFFGYFWESFLLWFAPRILASGMIVYFFGYLVHPEEHTERYLNTKVHLVEGKYAPFANVIWFFQCFHLIHHLFPKIPFYRYPEAFRDMRPLLEQAGSQITVHGQAIPARPGAAANA